MMARRNEAEERGMAYDRGPARDGRDSSADMKGYLL